MGFSPTVYDTISIVALFKFIQTSDLNPGGGNFSAQRSMTGCH